MNNIDEHLFYSAVSNALIANQPIKPVIEQFQCLPEILIPLLNFYSKNKPHLLSLACAQNNLDNVKTLISFNIDINARSPSPEKMLSEHGEPPSVHINIRDKYRKKVLIKQTALITASKSGFLEIVECLLASKANITLKDEYGLSALDWAKRKKHTAVVNLLENFTESLLSNRPRIFRITKYTNDANLFSVGLSLAADILSKVTFSHLLALTGVIMLISAFILAYTAAISIPASCLVGGVGFFALQQGYQNLTGAAFPTINLSNPF